MQVISFSPGSRTFEVNLDHQRSAKFSEQDVVRAVGTLKQDGLTFFIGQRVTKYRNGQRFTGTISGLWDDGGADIIWDGWLSPVYQRPRSYSLTRPAGEVSEHPDNHAVPVRPLSARSNSSNLGVNYYPGIKGYRAVNPQSSVVQEQEQHEPGQSNYFATLDSIETSAQREAQGLPYMRFYSAQFTDHGSFMNRIVNALGQKVRANPERKMVIDIVSDLDNQKGLSKKWSPLALFYRFAKSINQTHGLRAGEEGSVAVYFTEVHSLSKEAQESTNLSHIIVCDEFLRFR